MPTSLSSSKLTSKSRVVRSPRLTFNVQVVVAQRGLPSTAQFRSWARAALVEDAEVTLRLVGRDEAASLNASYRHRQYAPNVLTFVYGDARPVCGDIVLCLPVIREEARDQEKSLVAHLAHLTVHGMLHLQGFDHGTDQDAELMEGLETEILARLGYADPYADPLRSSMTGR